MNQINIATFKFEHCWTVAIRPIKHLTHFLRHGGGGEGCGLLAKTDTMHTCIHTYTLLVSGCQRCSVFFSLFFFFSSLLTRTVIQAFFEPQYKAEKQSFTTTVEAEAQTLKWISSLFFRKEFSQSKQKFSCANLAHISVHVNQTL